MAKMTLGELKNFATSYVAAAQQAGAWQETHNNLYKVLDKVGKMITLDGEFQDSLPELSGDDLPLGKTIEEYFIDLTMPVDFKAPDNSGTGYAEAALKPYLPDTEEPAYSYSLGRKVLPTTIPYDNVERGAVNAEAAGNMIAKVSEKFADSGSLYRYALKKQLIGNMITKAIAENDGRQTENEKVMVSTIAKPIDTATGEAFIKEVKTIKENFEFANEHNCLANTLIGKTPESNLILYIKKGVLPSLEVDTMTGAYHLDKIAIPCRVKVVDDFGSADEKVYAVMLDSRGIKLHKDYLTTKPQENAFSDFVNLFEHSEYTGFISKFTAVHVFKAE